LILFHPLATNFFLKMENYSNQQLTKTSISTHYLYPAALFANVRPHLVTTVLGTCVAVCLWDRVKAIGGINHYMLPYWNGVGLATPKYGNIAIERLYQKMLKMGCRPETMIAKIFGGKQSDDIESVFNIGERNATLAFEMMHDYRIEVAAKSVGGPYGRKLQFITNLGEVRMKYVGQAPLNARKSG
jgi:chemotaxis protein CheD